jgi:1-acyl-sn-glycerol-3-phosphate acyltransferase
MPVEETISPKPRSEVVNPQLTRLAQLTLGRKVLRHFVRWLSKLLVFLWTRSELIGSENIPQKGPALLVSNHLGDADLILGFAYAPPIVEPFAKIELYDIPILGRLLDAYGVIWVHRGQPDRRALRAVMEAMQQGRMVGIAPEGRESLTGALEEGTDGAAYLALRADIPITPITFTGTENKRVFHNMKRFKRTDVSVTIGKPFRLEKFLDLRDSIKFGTKKIMHTLAQQLPSHYRGFYEYETRDSDEC